MKLVYVCSPFSADPIANIERAKRYCRDISLQMCHVVPFSPLLLFPQFLDEEKQRDLALNMCLETLSRCDEVWVYSHNGTISAGMKHELQQAKQMGKKIRYISESLKGVEEN